jgi:hypothetical protein
MLIADAMHGLALAGVLFVTASAAVWGKAISIRPTSVTVTLPPPRVASNQNDAPISSRKVPRMAEGSFSLADQPSLQAARANGDSTLADLNVSGGSRYTSLEPAACTILGDQENSTSPRQLCAGIAGYQLETGVSGTTRYLVIMNPDGRRSQIELDRIGGNGSLGRFAEWRAARAGDPRALIVRVSAPGKNGASSLIVARLDDAPCIIAVIPRGPRQNEKARAVADQDQRECRTTF